MKNFIFYFFLCFVATVFAQKKNVSQSIISDDVSIKKYHNKIILMQCTSLYPCPYDKIGLNVINELKS